MYLPTGSLSWQGNPRIGRSSGDRGRELETGRDRKPTWWVDAKKREREEREREGAKERSELPRHIPVRVPERPARPAPSSVYARPPRPRPPSALSPEANDPKPAGEGAAQPPQRPKEDDPKEERGSPAGAESKEENPERVEQTDKTKEASSTDKAKQPPEETPVADKPKQASESRPLAAKPPATREGEGAPAPASAAAAKGRGARPAHASSPRERPPASARLSDGSSLSLSGLDLASDSSAQASDGKDASSHKRKSSRDRGDGQEEEAAPPEGEGSGGGERALTGVEVKRARGEMHAWVSTNDLLRAAGAFDPAARGELEIVKMVRIKRKPCAAAGGEGADAAAAPAPAPGEVHAYTQVEDAEGVTIAHTRLRSFLAGTATENATAPAPADAAPPPQADAAAPDAARASTLRNPFAQGAFGLLPDSAPATAPPATPTPAPASAPAPKARGERPEETGGQEPQLPPQTQAALRLATDRIVEGALALRRRLGASYASQPHAPHVDDFIGLEREAEARRMLPHVRDAILQLRSFFQHDEMAFGLLTAETMRRSALPENEIEEVLYYLYRMAVRGPSYGGVHAPPPTTPTSAPKRAPWEKFRSPIGASSTTPPGDVSSSQTLTPSTTLVNIHLYPHGSPPSSTISSPGSVGGGPGPALCAQINPHSWRLQQQEQTACSCTCVRHAHCSAAMQQVHEAADSEFSSFHNLSDLQMSHGQRFAFHGNRRNFLS